jgi:hypothetical protein
MWGLFLGYLLFIGFFCGWFLPVILMEAYDNNIRVFYLIIGILVIGAILSTFVSGVFIAVTMLILVIVSLGVHFTYSGEKLF